MGATFGVLSNLGISDLFNRFGESIFLEEPVTVRLFYSVAGEDEERCLEARFSCVYAIAQMQRDNPYGLEVTQRVCFP